jgi:hypothetical protein
VCKQYFGLEQGSQSLEEYYNLAIEIFKEQNMYQLLSTGMKVIEKQRQDVDVQFLIGLKLEYESVYAQILGGLDIPSLPKVFSQIQCATLSNSSSHISSNCSGDVMLLLPLAAVLVVGDVEVDVVIVHMVDVILEEVVLLGVVNLENVLIVAVVIIM